MCCSKRARLMREKASINWPKSCCFLLFEAIFLFWLFKHLSDHLWAKYLDSVLFFRIGETCDKWTEFRLRDKGIFVLLVLHQIWLFWTAALVKKYSFLCKKNPVFFQSSPCKTFRNRCLIQVFTFHQKWKEMLSNYRVTIVWESLVGITNSYPFGQLFLT